VLLAEVVAFNLVVFTVEVDNLAVVVCERLVDNFTVLFLTEEDDDLAVAICVGAVDNFNILFVTEEGAELSTADPFRVLTFVLASSLSIGRVSIIQKTG